MLKSLGNTDFWQQSCSVCYVSILLLSEFLCVILTRMCVFLSYLNLGRAADKTYRTLACYTIQYTMQAIHWPATQYQHWYATQDTSCYTPSSLPLLNSVCLSLTGILLHIPVFQSCVKDGKRCSIVMMTMKSHF